MKKKTRIAAISDIHVTETSQNQYVELFKHISIDADILVICGDLTDKGLTSEAELLAKELQNCTIPVIACLGNHDYEHGQEKEITKILTNERVTILEGEGKVIDDIGFVGLKGFAGGFDKYMLAPWGEQAIKQFVNEAVNDALKLERVLTRLQTKHKVVLLHYAPIRQTVEGEPIEIFPFLGCSRLAEPIIRLGADVVFHGHTHHGTHEGIMGEHIPVFNVSIPILQKTNPKKPYMVFEI
jgi:Icc-related predicted phosphoesterase